MPLITTTKKDGLGILEIPERMTSLTPELLDEIKVGFRALAVGDETKLIIFLAVNNLYGMSIPYIYETIKAGDRVKTEIFLKDIHEFVTEIRTCIKPTLGVALGQYLLGGALEILRSCEYFAVFPHTMLGLVEEGIGIMPGFGGTAFSDIIGVRKTAEMIVSAKMYSAEKALEMGLVNRIITNVNAPKKVVTAYAREILAGTAVKNSPQVIVPKEADFTEEELLRYGKGKSRFAVTKALEAIREGAKHHYFPGALAVERGKFLDVCFTQNALEGVTAFMEGRKPKFTDTIGG